jgi:hypothetical protein
MGLPSFYTIRNSSHYKSTNLRPVLFTFLVLFFLGRAHTQDSPGTDSAGRERGIIEIEASYPGGEKAWKKFLEKQLTRP